MRLLIIDEDPRFRALLRHHASCRWPHAVCVEYDPAVRGPLAPQLRACGFDAVLLGGPASTDGRARLDWLEDLTRRSGFAPVMYFSGRRDDDAAHRASALGAAAVFGRDRIEHDALIAALASAGERRMAREAAEADAYRFGAARIPGYRCVRRLASGAFAELYVAESELEPVLVTVKVARAPGSERDGARATSPGGMGEIARASESSLDQAFRRLRQEHEAARRIASPRVVRMLDLGVSGPHAYLVMEYFGAGSLRERMRRPMTCEEALGYALEIARGLQAVHGGDVLHRDLKPGNVMLREDGSLALIDFGMAHAADLDAANPTLISGTPHYMSPEQGHGEPIDARSDLYSLGVILYEMLAGRKPFTADNPMAIIYMHRKMPLPALPPPLARLQPLLERLLAKSPADRFASAAAAAEALQEALGDPAERAA